MRPFTLARLTAGVILALALGGCYYPYGWHHHGYHGGYGAPPPPPPHYYWR